MTVKAPGRSLYCLDHYANSPDLTYWESECIIIVIFNINLRNFST